VIIEEVPAALDGERLDRVVSLLADVSRSDAAVIVAAGGATVDGVVATSGKVRLRVGQTVTVDETLAPQAVLPAADPSVDVRVVLEDEYLLIIDKPAGLVVHPGAGNPDRTLVNGLLARYPQIAGVGEPIRPGIVHRLDAGTSGLLVVAKTTAAYHGLVDALSSHRVERIYRALVWGHPASPSGVIDAPIGRDHRDPMRMAVVVDGKPARTHYRTLQRFRRPAETTSLECQLETGRTHQIRVHLAAIGHPVVGDPTYGGVKSAITIGRPVLHAAELRFTHPVTGAPVAATSPLPDDLRLLLESLDPVVDDD
jgi:23S rRNA pseudouridine1911/1915/1917 synthase